MTFSCGADRSSHGTTKQRAIARNGFFMFFLKFPRRLHIFELIQEDGLTNG
jgi:hypothetical protein